MSVRAILTDIEGTTSSIAFVHDVLFPYARERLASFVETHEAELADELAQVRVLAGPLDPIGQLLAWADDDRKITPLKAIQGRIWAQGYADGTLLGHVYPDAVEGLRRWHARGLALYVYSSGSVAAQKLLFGHTGHGDLTPLFSGWFDSNVGGKTEAASYRAIAQAIGLPAGEILFLSDMTAELAAASEAGMQVVLLARDGAPDGAYPAADGFAAILPEVVA